MEGKPAVKKSIWTSLKICPKSLGNLFKTLSATLFIPWKKHRFKRFVSFCFTMTTAFEREPSGENISCFFLPLLTTYKFHIQGWTNFYLGDQLGTQKMGAENQIIRPTGTQLEILLFTFYYLNITHNLHF